MLYCGLYACGCATTSTTITPKIEELNRQIAADPGNAGLLRERGYVFARLGESGKAVSDYEAGIRRQPQDAGMHWSYGWALLNIGYHQKALREWQMAIALCEEPPWWAPHTLAIGYWINGDKSRALESYDQAARNYPDRFGGWEALVDYTSYWSWEEKITIYSIYDAWYCSYREQADGLRVAYNADMVRRVDRLESQLKMLQAAMVQRPIIPAADSPSEVVLTPDSSASSKFQVGESFPPLVFQGIDGKEVGTSNLLGQVVLVDFWATWCGPCRMEVPGLVSLYRECRDAGFEILGISLDRDRAAMDQYLSASAMTWPQYFDGKAWANEISKCFDIHGIPATFLIDRSGKLRFVNLRGERLAVAVRELLKEKPAGEKE